MLGLTAGGSRSPQVDAMAVLWSCFGRAQIVLRRETRARGFERDNTADPKA